MFSSPLHGPPAASRRIRRFAILRFAILVPAAAGLSAGLGACSGDTVRTLAVDAGYGPKTVEAPDFVRDSRDRQAPDFLAVGVDAPRRPVRAKSAEGQRALEAELEGARGRNEARGRAAESAGKGTGKGMGNSTGAGKAAAAPPSGLDAAAE